MSKFGAPWKTKLPNCLRDGLFYLFTKNNAVSELLEILITSFMEKEDFLTLFLGGVW